MSVFRSNVKWQIASSAAQAILSGFVLLILGRFLSAGGFGHYSIIMSFVIVANLMMEPRMQDVVARHFWDFGENAGTRAQHREHFVDFLIFEVVVKLAPCAALVALAVPIVRFADLPAGSAWLIAIAALGNYFVKFAFGLSTGLLRILGRSDLFALCVNGELIVRLAALATLAVSGNLTVASSIVTFALSGMLANAVQLALAARHVPLLRDTVRIWKPRAALARLRPHRRLLLSNIGLSGSDLMNKDLDIALLSPVMPAEQIGVYKMAKNVAQLAWRAIDPFTLALMPEISRRIAMGDYAGTRSLVRRSAIGLGVLSFGLAAGAYIGLVLFGTQLFGQDFAAMPSLMIWMLVGTVLGAPLVWAHPLAVALNRADLPFMGNLLSLAIGLGAFVVLVSLFGIVGAAIAWAMTFLPFFVFTALAAFSLFKSQESQASQHASDASSFPNR
jgi:O-antigen/teichoic acid export membrane protein